ncbi:heavy metal-associated domain-containing protein [Salegentibacter sp. F188]|jgi:copper chaperone CopZ|uniref:Heavy metal-associated domain-containing protein n=1 Tax=Autumnicola patrickiae TaxID=3075591 RepID=A0ABU3E5Y1_9FLAO|nr:heavy metal-associated domain-containing protein [Salegentibacter sp. F188]MDT0691350.1 heavy metal-associated domain-containing protein [Salegentibacter sp. F188]
MIRLRKEIFTALLTGTVLVSSGNPASAMEQKNENQIEFKTQKNMNKKILHLKIKGMHCQSGCANGIDAMLKEQKGIIKSETSFDKSSSIIEYDPEQISEEKIISLIKDRGFEVEIVTEKGASVNR